MRVSAGQIRRTRLFVKTQLISRKDTHHEEDFFCRKNVIYLQGDQSGMRQNWLTSIEEFCHFDNFPCNFFQIFNIKRIKPNQCQTKSVSNQHGQPVNQFTTLPHDQCWGGGGGTMSNCPGLAGSADLSRSSK